jgi:hypothetical protein
MPVQGAIADAARAVLPVTWDALSRDTDRFGDGLLADTIEVVIEEMLGSVVDETALELLPLRAIRYMGKKVALELIPAGIDFWMSEPVQESAEGPNETHTWIDRANRLMALGESLGWEIRRDEPLILALLGRKATPKNLPRMGISTPADDVLLTPDPRGFPAPFKQGTGQRLS